MHRDYNDLLREFNEGRVEYLVVGAHALGYYLEPRYTKDLDVWIRCTRENAERSHRALARFGAPLHGVSPADLERPGFVYQIGVEPVRVDVLTSISGVEFDAAHERRVTAKVGALEIPLLGLEDLLANKLAAGRPQDLVDAAAIREEIRRRRG